MEVTKTITIIAYEKIDVSDDNTTMRRVNEVEAITQVDFEAAISKILVSSANKNAFQVLKYRYKKTSESSYGSYVDISSAASASDTRVTYESDEFVLLDPDYSYHVEFYVSDKITSDTFVITLPPAIPLISKRHKKVGINNKNPTSALDVTGEIKQNGIYVLGYCGKVTGDFNNYTSGGVYNYSGIGGINAPGSAGMLEVITNGAYVIQRFTEYSSGCNLYIRSSLAFNTWTEWTQK